MDKTENKTVETTANGTAPRTANFGNGPRGRFQRPQRSFGDKSKNPRKPGARGTERIKPEYDQKILNIRRVTRVTKGGKRMNFSVHMVIGNKKGAVGVGTGKANDTSLAIDKAYRSSKKNILNLSLTKDMSISKPVSAKYSSGRIVIMPAKGRGVRAGSAVKTVLELAGIKDVTAKIISPSKNKLNIARATLLALSVFDKKRAGSFVKEMKQEEIKEKAENNQE